METLSENEVEEYTTISEDIEEEDPDEAPDEAPDKAPEEAPENEVKVPKRRGRKPKIKEEEVKVLKKRGRKPKEKIYSIKDINKAFFDKSKNETLILHLPIKKNDINNEEPVPISKHELHFFNFDDDEYIKDDTVLFNNENLLESNKQTVIKKPEETETKINNKMLYHRLNNILYEFIGSNHDNNWPMTTSTYCWWCCHSFNWTPCALPENYIKNKFYVYGCFCSFNCVASYNFSLNDNDMWERYSLLNLMYCKINEKKFIKISLAPPREILRIFGGYMSIEEFRENCYTNDKNFKILKPPLISIIPKIEENNYNINKNKISYIPVNKELIERAENTIKLKRDKPIINPSFTLQTFMDLKKV